MFVCLCVCVCVCLNVCKNGVKVFSFLYVATTYVGHMGGVWILYVAKQPWVLWDNLGVSGLKCLRAIVCVQCLLVPHLCVCSVSVCLFAQDFVLALFFLLVCFVCIGTTASVPQHVYYNINVVDVVNGEIHAISVSVMSWCACIARLCTPPRKT